MAGAIIKILLDNLNILIKDEIGMLLGVNGEMKKLSSILTTIQAVVEDAEDKQLRDNAIRIWLRNLNDLSYEIEDVLDEFATEVEVLKYKRRSSTVIINVHKTVRKIWYQHNIGKRMKEVTEKLDNVSAERANFHLHKADVVMQSKVPATRETGSVLNGRHLVYGRDEEKEKIVDILVNRVKDLQELSVLAIIGVGGLGKTTLAQLVYNDERVIKCFDLKLWVCVYDNFDMKTLIKAMIASSTRSGKASNLTELDPLQQILFQLLNQKRYLLVLDDVWNDVQEKWSALKDLLACGSPGSSILVTTRQKKVADIMCTVPAHALEGLSEQSCWLLFKQQAFGQQDGERAKFEAIGKQIVKKCAGVPLAAKTIGSLLQFESKEEAWHRVRESEIWNLPQKETSILPALRLSYNHLPFEYRHCFAYCAIFPKNSIIKKEDLIFLWMANGFISSEGTLEVEDVGNKILNELVLRSLFDNVEPNSHEPFSLQMHDLIHDLAQSIMENKIPGLPAEGDNTLLSNSRYVNLEKKFVAFPTRTFSQMDLPSVLLKFKRLRVLDASCSDITKVPSTIGSLNHVRYINLSYTDIQNLPNELCSLWNLKILNLEHCWQLVSLPKNLSRLRNLRHLLLRGLSSLRRMPPKIGELISLKTLNLFIVGEKGCSKLGELQFLDIAGTLTIRNLARVKNHLEAKKANLAEKSHLRILSLYWNRQTTLTSSESLDEKVLEALEPHAKLTHLYIGGYQAMNFPLWIKNSKMVELVSLTIAQCPNCSSLPQLGELPCLKRLHLSDLVVHYIIEGEVQGLMPKFPVLEVLDLCRLPFLRGMLEKETSEVVFPNLRNLNVVGCSLLSFPRLSSLVVLYCDDKVPHTSFHNLENLKSLEILCGENMTSIPKESLESLTCLKYLSIRKVNDGSFPEEGWQNLKSLTKLKIWDTKQLRCLPEKWFPHLTALEELNLNSCSELLEIPESIKFLQNLKALQLFSLPKISCSLKALELLPLLLHLHLKGLCQLTSLPDHLPSLVSLSITDCPKLVPLPANLQEWTKLEHLTIFECPELERRCEKGKGEDWNKIAHIPYLDIG